jgi:hypothetical protein
MTVLLPKQPILAIMFENCRTKIVYISSPGPALQISQNFHSAVLCPECALTQIECRVLAAPSFYLSKYTMSTLMFEKQCQISTHRVSTSPPISENVAAVPSSLKTTLPSKNNTAVQY